MFRRGWTGVAWLLGLAAVTYTDVVAPIAQAAFGDRVIHERVHEVEPDAVRNDLSTALMASGQGSELNWMDAVAGRSVEAWDVTRMTAVQNMAAGAPAEWNRRAHEAHTCVTLDTWTPRSGISTSAPTAS